MNLDYFLNKIYTKEINIIKKDLSIECLCSSCKEKRKMNLQMWDYESNPIKPIIYSGTGSIYNQDSEKVIQVKDSVFPSLWIATCKQCNEQHFIVLYKLNNNKKILIISESFQGIATNHTPDAVKYYLDEAYKCKMIGANSACVSMYRAALEQVLFEQGYTDGMLNKKIRKLEEDKKNGCSKEWVMNIDEDIFKYIKNLGNGSIHPNDGDISKQYTFNNRLIDSIDIVFKEILNQVYEIPIEKRKLKERLKEAAKIFEK